MSGNNIRVTVMPSFVILILPVLFLFLSVVIYSNKQTMIREQDDFRRLLHRVPQKGFSCRLPWSLEKWKDPMQVFTSRWLNRDEREKLSENISMMLRWSTQEEHLHSGIFFLFFYLQVIAQSLPMVRRFSIHLSHAGSWWGVAYLCTNQW